jgi:hypothetical protein
MPRQPHNEILRNLDAQIAALEQHLQRLKYARWAIEDQSVFQRLDIASGYTVEELAALTGVPMPLAPVDGSPLPGGPPGITHFGKIVMYYKAKKNEWAPSNQLAADLNLKESVVREVLYKTHKDHFERQQNPEGRGKVFRLKHGA